MPFEQKQCDQIFIATMYYNYNNTNCFEVLTRHVPRLLDRYN